MPIPIHTRPDPPLFPTLSVQQIDAARLSSWYHTFEDLTIPSTVIELEEIGEKETFIKWLASESIFMPLDTEPGTSANAESENGAPEGSQFHLPKLGKRIRETIEEYGGSVFPKLNWTAPRDAAFLLPQTQYGPLHCQTPYDIYLLLKSSDFLSHSMDPERAYAMEGNEEVGGGDIPTKEDMKLELLLRKYESINPSREFRCFVREDILLGISVKDFNYYPHFQDPQIREKVCETVRSFFEDEVLGDYAGGRDYIFDIVLDDQHSHPRIIDFNPYNPSSDPLLFTYDDLHDILLLALSPIPSSSSSSISTLPTGDSDTHTRPRLPILKVIDSQSHPEANRGMPAFGTNMMPVEVVEMSQGRGIGEFKDAWDQLVREGIAREGNSESGSDSE